MRARLRCQFVQDAVHVLVPVGTAIALGQFHAFVDRHPIGNAGIMNKFVS